MTARKLLYGTAFALAGVLATSGLASAQWWDDDFGSSSLFDNDFDDLLDDVGLCVTDGGGLANILDVDTRARVSERSDRDIDLDEDDVLLGIAVSRNLGRVDFEDLAEVDIDRRLRAEFDQDVDIDRDDVLLGLALGVDSRLSDDELLACASDIEWDTDIDLDIEQDVDLDEDNVLLAIALDNNGARVDFDDIVSRTTSRSFEIDRNRDVDIDRDDALWLLAFG